MREMLMQMFGRPKGILGRLGGIIMSRMNEGCGAWVTELLEVRPNDTVLEVGFGPGVTIGHLSKLTPRGHVDGIDLSHEMVEQASARNATAVRNNRVDLQRGSVDGLPFDHDHFDKVLAINSMQVWPDAAAGLREIRRVMKPAGRLALGFTIHSGQPNQGLTELLTAAGFTNANVMVKDTWFCALASKPNDPGAVIGRKVGAVADRLCSLKAKNPAIH
jgi:ubiquinone/menaquinone biosynthesis C-methylase UbiE